jgi:hypothetical protein
MLRIDRTVRPTVFRGATLAILEVEALSTIKGVVRKGHVRQIERDAIVLEKGTVDAAPDDLYVDCTAKAFSRRPPVPVFNEDHITLQVLRAGSYCFSAAFIAHAEAVYDDDAIKNDLCAPLSTPDVVADSPSTGYRAADSEIPARRRVPTGYAFLSVCAKPLRGLRQTWHGLSPTSIDPSRIGKADAALVRSWHKSDLSSAQANVCCWAQSGSDPG